MRISTSAAAAATTYRQKLCSPRAVVDRLRRDDTLAFPIATGQPAAFLAALGERDDWRNLVAFGGLLIEPYSFVMQPLDARDQGTVEHVQQCQLGRSASPPQRRVECTQRTRREVDRNQQFLLVRL